MDAIKINRAMRQSGVGCFPGSAADMLALVPPIARAQLTSAGLAAMLDALWAACRQSKHLAEAEACTEGAVWDARHGRLREIVA